MRSATRAGVPVLVDGAHGPGQVPLDLPAIGADWYVGNCHKWLSAPKGCGFLHARADRRAELHPVTISHGYGQGFIEEFDWTGTMDATAFLALPAALDFFRRLGGAAMTERNRRLVSEAATFLAAELGTEVGARSEMVGALASVRLPFDLPSAGADALKCGGPSSRPASIVRSMRWPAVCGCAFQPMRTTRWPTTNGSPGCCPASWRALAIDGIRAQTPQGSSAYQMW